jgi:hypothetical protein
MVSPPLRLGGRGAAVTRRYYPLLAVAVVVPACRGDRGAASTAASPAERAADRVKASYHSPDLLPAAAYAWTAPSGVIFVLVDVESGVAGVVQARADLWAVADSAPVPIGRSDVMPSAATIGVFAFEDVTGDGIPDLLGYVADSAGIAFPIFVAGARGAMAEQIEIAAPRYHLSADPEQAPRVYSGPKGPCAIEAWADAPAPDSLPAGWRYLPLLRSGQLGAPAAVPPACQ